MKSQQRANVDESNLIRTIKLLLLCAWSSASFHLQGGIICWVKQLRCFPSPVLFIDMCGARLPSSENRKVLQGGEDEDYGYQERLKQIWELHSQLEPGHAEFRAQETL